MENLSVENRKRGKLVSVSPEDKVELERLARLPSTPQNVASWARVILAAHESPSYRSAAVLAGHHAKTVQRWCERYERDGLAGLTRKPGSGRALDADFEARVLTTALTEVPEARTHWTQRALAERVGSTQSRIFGVLKRHNLRPQQTRAFKVSWDPKFEQKLVDVVGLYLNPPENAVVLSMDEKSQIQALERTREPLPATPGHPAELTHDYKRHGTLTFFAALELATGAIIGDTKDRHRNVEFIEFLETLVLAYPGQKLHIILDNYSPHKHKNVLIWLEKHPLVELHFTPTSCSWMNLIERVFNDLQRQRLARSSFSNLAEVSAAIHEWVEVRNRKPPILRWHKTPTEILAKVKRRRTITKSAH